MKIPSWKKHHLILVGASSAIVMALVMGLAFWPRGQAEPEIVTQAAPSEEQAPEPRATFANATLLTAAEPSSFTVEETAQPILPAPEVQQMPLSDHPPISFMPKRDSLAENDEWQNGWDEPVVRIDDESLPTLPDWTTVPKRLEPTAPVAKEQTPSDVPVDSTSVAAQVPTSSSYNGPWHTLHADDTPWTISQKVYGTGALFAALARFNHDQGINLADVEVGEQVAIPPAALLKSQYPGLCPAAPPQSRSMPTPDAARRPEYRVQADDTLERIAVIRLGRADRWREILALNHDVIGASGGHLKPGLVLSLPDDARSAATVLRPSDINR
ncbi:MAG: LysM peptidoglycan-binding domain-containing protein [Pirellulales bacterium]|nr:LysM peptidoglycan-binding domain-containing protein [Pirellulales bacterium]